MMKSDRANSDSDSSTVNCLDIAIRYKNTVNLIAELFTTVLYGRTIQEQSKPIMRRDAANCYFYTRNTRNVQDTAYDDRQTNRSAKNRNES